MAHSEELLALWRAKITSLAAFREAVDKSMTLGMDSRMVRDVLAQIRWHFSPYDPMQGGFVLDSDDLWPAARDAIRQHLGVYEEPTSVLTWLRTQSGVAGMWAYPHISREDPTMVAFSPDTNGAMNDVKVRTTVGKLARKLLPMLSDTMVAELTQLHTSELDPHFDVARTIEDIETVYTSMVGDSGCMRHSRSEFELEDYHPSVVYSSEHFGVAYMGELNNPKARAVIWDNPNDPSDKRFVRVYGNPVLGTKLKRAGYRCAGLAGTRLKMFFDQGEPSHVVMPYLDPPGGRDSGLTDQRGVNGVAFEGDDHILVLSDEQTQRAQEAGLQTMGLQGTGGQRRLVRNSRNHSLMVTDHFTGETLNILTDDVQTILVEENEQLFVRYSRANNPAMERFTESLVLYRNDTGIAALVDEGTKQKWAFPGNRDFAFEPETVKALGYRMLDPSRYGPRQYEYSSDSLIRLPGTFLWVRKSDSMLVFDAKGDPSYVADTQEQSLRDQGYVPTPSKDGMVVLSHPDNPNLVKLNSGRRAVMGCHDIVTLWDGGFAVRSSATQVKVLGLNEMLPGDTPDSLDLPAEFWGYRAGRLGVSWPPVERTVQGWMRQTVAWGSYNSMVWLCHNGELTRHSTYDDCLIAATIDDFVKAAEYILANPSHREIVRGHGFPDRVLAWAKAVLSLNRAYQATRTQAEPASPEQVAAAVNEAAQEVFGLAQAA